MDPFDYGEGKTRAQESHDSVRMLGCALVYVIFAIIVLVLAVLFLYL